MTDDELLNGEKIRDVDPDDPRLRRRFIGIGLMEIQAAIGAKRFVEENQLLKKLKKAGTPRTKNDLRSWMQDLKKEGIVEIVRGPKGDVFYYFTDKAIECLEEAAESLERLCGFED